MSAMLVSACDSATDGDRFVGELASDRIELSAEVAEPIIEVLVAEGETVTKGEVLMRHDAQRATARLAEAEAALGQTVRVVSKFPRRGRTSMALLTN
jgi:multidrug resistance efflux pump